MKDRFAPDAPALPPLFLAEPDRASWEQTRRQALLELFAQKVYGVPLPANTYSTAFQLEFLAAEHQLMKVKVTGPLGIFTLPVDLHLPQADSCPIILFLSIWPRAETRLDEAGQFPLERLLKQGYGAAIAYTEDITPDCDGCFPEGILSAFEADFAHRAPNTMGAIGAWAFGLQRIMDCLVQTPGVDPARIAVAGHSRGGKTALWAAAQDTRFAAVFANESGCTGAALSLYKDGEQIADINGYFPYWFCENYKQYNHMPAPFDQHMLLAMAAPRLLYISSAAEDVWADPAAEYASLCEAQFVYTLYGPSVLPGQIPAAGKQVYTGFTGYHCRLGVHDLTAEDWQYFLQFIKNRL